MSEEEDLAHGLTKEKKSFSLVWIAPIIAILITSGMIYKSYIDKGTRIYIVVDNGDGIKDGKTPIMYKGIKIGVVEDTHIKADDVSKLEITAVIDKESSSSVTREGNKFWKVEPKITLTEISGLHTIIGGVYIAVMPAATSKEELLKLPYQDHFIGLDSAPVDVFKPGLSIVVNTSTKGDIAIGAPVLYNKQAIGKVEDKKLSKDKLGIDLYLRIKSEYADLIHKKSIFYKLDALEVKADLSGLKVNIGSFASFIAGGISVKNTDESLSSSLASEKEYFKLYDNEESIYLTKDEIMLSTHHSYKLKPNVSKVYCKGVEAGIVSSLEYDPQKNVTNIKLKLFESFRKLANEKAYFWIVKPTINFNKVEGLETIIKGNYINFLTYDYKAKKASTFVLHEKKPQIKGRHVYLVTDDIQSIREGAGLFYHGIEIGQIDSYKLNKDKRTFTIDVIVEPKYISLLNSSSLFYHKSGIEIQADFTKVELKTGSLETILRGGISVETPDQKASKKLKKRYKLYKSHMEILKAQYLAENGLYLTLVSDRLGSLKKGSAIFFKQIKVGEVVSYKWDSKSKKLLLKVFIVQEYAKEVQENTLFYNASGIRAKMDLNGLTIDTESIETIMAGGIAFYTPPADKKKQARSNSLFKLYDSKEEAMENFIDITLISDDSAGLEIGSALKYKNVTLGHVEEISLVNKRVHIKLKLDAKYEDLIKKDTVFWLETFKVDLGGIKNPSAVIHGPHIVLKPGVSKEKSEVYYLMQDSPVPHFNDEGLRVIIESSRLGSIKVNTPVYYRQIKIGSVVQYRLNSDATKVEIEVFIDPCFSHLIRNNSYFYTTSGIGMEINLFGAKMKTESMESILTGAIGVLTPDNYSKASKDFQVFDLHETFNERALKWAPKLYSNNPMCE